MLNEKTALAILAGLTLTGCPEAATRESEPSVAKESARVSATPVTATKEGHTAKDGGKGSCGPGACG